MGISWKQFFKKQYLVLICQKSVFEHNNSKAQRGIFQKPGWKSTPKELSFKNCILTRNSFNHWITFQPKLEAFFSPLIVHRWTPLNLRAWKVVRLLENLPRRFLLHRFALIVHGICFWDESLVSHINVVTLSSRFWNSVGLIAFLKN